MISSISTSRCLNLSPKRTQILKWKQPLWEYSISSVYTKISTLFRYLSSLLTSWLPSRFRFHYVRKIPSQSSLSKALKNSPYIASKDHPILVGMVGNKEWVFCWEAMIHICKFPLQSHRLRLRVQYLERSCCLYYWMLGIISSTIQIHPIMKCLSMVEWFCDKERDQTQSSHTSIFLRLWMYISLSCSMFE